MKDDQENKQGQGGGPKTDVGKAVSSKNALTHGVTSSKITSIEETQTYQKLLDDFRACLS